MFGTFILKLTDQQDACILCIVLFHDVLYESMAVILGHVPPSLFLKLMQHDISRVAHQILNYRINLIEFLFYKFFVLGKI